MREFILILSMVLATTCFSKEYHVSVRGNDRNNGSKSKPLQTIMAAASKAQPGDIITVHAGIYREQITPLRGGTSDDKRIVYQAAPEARVEIKGSEIIGDWKNVEKGVWKVIIPNTFFKDHNPYQINLTGDWLQEEGHWNHTGEVYLNGQSLFETKTLDGVFDPVAHDRALDKEAAQYTWYCETDENETMIWANFHDFDPNKELVEINVRETCFYPDKPGVNYITVKGFHMSQAATNWAAPTAEQVGLIGTHWSKGWIIEDCVIRNSKCSGITLGKGRKTGHNAWSKARAKGGAAVYNEVILKALKIGWSRENIGSHIVRNNIIYDCEQTGMCGSMGAAFSQVYNNHIHHIWRKRLFTGAEIGGIKFHAPIDVLLKNNCIHDAYRGFWMDWMTQGTRITANLCYNNEFADLFVEVNHGPYLVDNNIFLSGIHNWSQGGAFVHNLIKGQILLNQVPTRYTPYHYPHSTELMGFSNIQCGDDRYYNNIFVGSVYTLTRWQSIIVGTGLGAYNMLNEKHPVFVNNNVYYHGAQPFKQEVSQLSNQKHDPDINISVNDNDIYLEMTLDDAIKEFKVPLITTDSLGKTIMVGQRFEDPLGADLTLDEDYFGNPRNSQSPMVGPFEKPGIGKLEIKVW